MQQVICDTLARAREVGKEGEYSQGSLLEKVWALAHVNAHVLQGRNNRMTFYRLMHVR